MTINEPSLDPNKDTATLAWEKSVTETTNRMQHQIDNINESVNVPSNLIAVYSKTQDGAVQQFTPFADGDGFVAYVVYTDSLPTLPVSGATFSAYTDGEINVIIKQYIENATRPQNPGTTSYQVSGGVWSSSPNWTKTKLNRAGVNVWFSEARIVGQAGQTVTAKWSNAKLLYGGAVANGILYFNTASQSAPSAPTADGYDYDSGVFNNLTAGWGYLPITVAMGGGTAHDDKHWQVEFYVETSEVTNSQIITFGTVEGFQPIGSNLQSDTYQAGNTGWKIERLSGNAEFNNITARGNITAESITSGTLAAARIAATSLNADNITSGTINARNITGCNISGGTITAGGLTVTGGFSAAQLNVGVIVAVYAGVGGGAPQNISFGTQGTNTVPLNGATSFTSHNSTEFDTDFIVILTNLATVSQTQTGITIAVSLVQGNVNAQTGTPVATNVAASGNVNGTQNSTITTYKIQAAKNTTYYARNSFNSAGQANLGAGNGGCVVLEVRRT
tara:strand:- start:7963 stop:9477 length:1515 start_codon:yes stop_codon:yes gene_type:complete